MATTTIDAAGSDPIEILLANGGGTEVMRVTSAGKVGIGTASPTTKLHVIGDASVTTSFSGFLDLILKNTKTSDSAAGTRLMSYVADGTSGDPKIGLGVTGLQDYFFSIDNDDSDKLKLSSNDVEMLTVLTDGKVGIGTMSPVALLQAKCDGSSIDQLRLENSGTNGKVWAVSGGLDSAPGDLTVRDQTDGKTVAAFHYASVSNEDYRALRVGLRDGSQSSSRFESIGVGQAQTLLGSARNGNSMIMWLDNNSSSPKAELSAGFRNQADTDSFTAGYLVINKISGQNKGSLELATYNGSGFSTNAIYIDPDGKIGFGTTTIASGDSIKHANGAHLDTSGVWQNASSREYKKDITSLEHEEAIAALMALNPVKYKCKRDEEIKHVGFIAEDVPELVASKDRKGLSPMDIVGVLTKVVQEQQRKIGELAAALKTLAASETYN